MIAVDFPGTEYLLQSPCMYKDHLRHQADSFIKTIPAEFQLITYVAVRAMRQTSCAPQEDGITAVGTPKVEFSFLSDVLVVGFAIQ